jgi:glycosyltransferase involved in cell wall biosynthesis
MSASGHVPGVSVVITVRDGARYLGEAICSALAQTLPPLEVIVVDDGSRDDSGQVARAFGTPVRVITQAPAGIGAARNRGLAEVRADAVAFLDADDLWSPDKLALQTSALAHDPSLDLVFGHLRQFLSPDLSTEDKARFICPAEPQRGWIAGAMLATRRALSVIGPFSESVRAGEFIDWFMRAREAGMRTLMLPDVVLARRIHAGNHGVRERDAYAPDYLSIVRHALGRRGTANS